MANRDIDDAVRERAIEYAAQGWSNRRIAKRLDVHHDTVAEWKKDFIAKALQRDRERTPTVEKVMLLVTRIREDAAKVQESLG